MMVLQIFLSLEAGGCRADLANSPIHYCATTGIIHLPMLRCRAACIRCILRKPLYGATLTTMGGWICLLVTRPQFPAPPILVNYLSMIDTAVLKIWLRRPAATCLDL